jgi:hypothetical protein
MPHVFQSWPESLDDATFILDTTVRVTMHQGRLKTVTEESKHANLSSGQYHPHLADYAQVTFLRDTYRLTDINQDGKQDALILVRVSNPQNPLETQRSYLLLFHNIWMSHPQFIASSPALYGDVHALSVGHLPTGETVVRLGMYPKNTTYASHDTYESTSKTFDLQLTHQHWLPLTPLPSPTQTSRKDITVLSQQEALSNLQGLPKIFQHCRLTLWGKPYRFIRGTWVSENTMVSQHTPYEQLSLDASEFRLFDLDGDGARDGVFLLHGIHHTGNPQGNIESYLVALTHVDTPEQQTTLGTVAIRGKVQTLGIDTHQYPFAVQVLSRQWQETDSPCCPSLPYVSTWKLSLKGFR